MRPQKKLIIGVVFGFFGAAGILLGPLFGFSELVRPWSFILGFVFGVMVGFGFALSVSGLHEKRKNK